MADFIYAHYARQMRRVAVEAACVGVALTALTIILVGPVTDRGARAQSAHDSGDVYARLPAYPRPFTDAERAHIRTRLADANAALEVGRTLTDREVARLRALHEASTPPH